MSVLFWPPDPQYWQKPMVLFPNPQLSGSLAAPSMQLPVNEFAGNAQFVKSALICESALLPGFEHRFGFAMIIASLSACWAYSVLEDIF